MKKIKLAISGCMGRMGQQLIESSRKDKNFQLTVLTENKVINKKINGIEPDLNNEQAFKKVDVIIDFTVPKCTLEILKIATKLFCIIVSSICMPTVLGSNPILTPLPKVDKLDFPQAATNSNRKVKLIIFFIIFYF